MKDNMKLKLELAQLFVQILEKVGEFTTAVKISAERAVLEQAAPAPKLLPYGLRELPVEPLAAQATEQPVEPPVTEVAEQPVEPLATQVAEQPALPVEKIRRTPRLAVRQVLLDGDRKTLVDSLADLELLKQMLAPHGSTCAMASARLISRYLAFFYPGPANYNCRHMDIFLEEAEQLWNQQSGEALRAARYRFERGLRVCQQVFGGNAFRKPTGVRPSVVLFELQMVTLSQYPEEIVLAKQQELRDAMQRLVNEPEFARAIGHALEGNPEVKGGGTNDVTKVQDRWRIWWATVQQILGPKPAKDVPDSVIYGDEVPYDEACGDVPVLLQAAAATLEAAPPSEDPQIARLRQALLQYPAEARVCRLCQGGVSDVQLQKAGFIPSVEDPACLDIQHADGQCVAVSL